MLPGKYLPLLSFTCLLSKVEEKWNKGLTVLLFSSRKKAECFEENNTIQALPMNKYFIPVLNIKEMKYKIRY